MLEDVAGDWRIDDVTKPPLAERFQLSASRNLNFGLARSAYWVRISLEAGLAAPREWFLEIPYRGLDHADLYSTAEDGHVEIAHAGDLLPFTARPLPTRYPTFPIHLPPGGSATIELRVASDGPIVVPLGIWSTDGLREHLSQQGLKLGIFYGVLAAMMVQSLLFFLSLREPAYGWSFITLSLLAVGNLIEDGVAYQALWPGSPWWENRSFLVVVALGAASFLQFSRAYLDTFELFPRTDRFIRLLAAVWVVDAALALVMPYAWGIRVATVFALAGIPLTLVCAIGAARRHHRPARFYLLGLLAPALGGAVAGIENLGLVEPDSFTRSGFEVGVLAFAVLLSIGLADRISLMRRDKERAERDSSIDELTGIPNRRAFDAVLAREWARALRMHAPISLVMSDLDWFKRLNDSFGHVEGDGVLRRVAHAMQEAVRRPADVIARYGGEEFVVVLPDTDVTGATHVADALRAAVLGLGIPLGLGSDAPALSLSVGVATALPPIAHDPVVLVEAADRALYRAKDLGRNRVEIAITEAPRKARGPGSARG